MTQHFFSESGRWYAEAEIAPRSVFGLGFARFDHGGVRRLAVILGPLRLSVGMIVPPRNGRLQVTNRDSKLAA